MMYGHEKSDRAIVAEKPANKAERSAAELVERRAGTEGNADQQSTHWTQSQARVSQALERIRQVFAVTYPRWEPYAGKPHVRIWGGRGNSRPYREVLCPKADIAVGAAIWPSARQLCLGGVQFVWNLPTPAPRN
jgi:hypothetical protein